MLSLASDKHSTLAAQFGVRPAWESWLRSLASGRHGILAAQFGLRPSLVGGVFAAGSERQGRTIDKDQPGSMERKKREGYF